MSVTNDISMSVALEHKPHPWHPQAPCAVCLCLNRIKRAVQHPVPDTDILNGTPIHMHFREALRATFRDIFILTRGIVQNVSDVIVSMSWQSAEKLASSLEIAHFLKSEPIVEEFPMTDRRDRSKTGMLSMIYGFRIQVEELDLLLELTRPLHQMSMRGKPVEDERPIA